jgi:hypothetical protein
MSHTSISIAQIGPNAQILQPLPEAVRFETPTIQHLQALATTAAVEGLAHHAAVPPAGEVLVPTMKEEPKEEKEFATAQASRGRWGH